MTLVRRHITIIVFVLALPLLAVLLLQYSQLSKEKTGVEEETLAKAEQITHLADLQVSSTVDALRVLASSPIFLGGDWDSAKKRIHEVALLNPQWKNVQIIDLEEKKVIFGSHDGALPTLSARVFKLRDYTPLIEGVGFNCNGHPCINIFISLPVDGATSRYALAVAVDVQPIQQILLKHIPSQVIAAIVDREGNFVARSQQIEKFVGKPATIYVRNAMKRSDKGIYPGVTYEGFKNYSAFFTSQATGLSTHIAVASNLIDTPRLLALVFGGLGAVLTVVIGAGFISSLARKFESVASARLSAIVASSDDVIFSKDLNSILTSWNASAERIFGYSADEAIGKHVSLIIPEELLAEEAEIIRTIKQGKSVSHLETVRRRKDGSSIPMSITVSPIKDEQGKIIGASQLARDITEQKMSALQLQEHSETLETLNALAPALSSTLDLQALVQLVTDEATKLTGAAFGAFFYNIVNESGEALVLYTLSGAPKEAFSNLGMPRATGVFGPTFRGEGTILSDDITADPRYGKNKPYHGMPPKHLPVRSYLAVPVVSRTGEVIGGLFFGHPNASVFSERDAKIAEGIAALAAVGIDNSRLYEEVKKGKMKAEAASQAKSDFLATMSHEIRTPMNAIVGLSSILSMSKSLSVKEKEFVTTLQSAADNLLQLINDLLDFSKIEARSVELAEEPFSMSTLLDDVIRMMTVRVSEKGLKFEADTESIKGLFFVGDPSRLRQIFANLLSNAVKFTERGSVSVTVLRGESAAVGVAQISIIVSDTGIGIPQDKISKIFEKFVQADTSINRKYGGTGLGLAITKQIVEAMQGEINVESEIGKGTTFTVSLPLKLATEAGLVEKVEITVERQKDPNDIKVLVVEDFEPNVLVATTFLDKLGYPFEIAREGKQAVEMAMKGDFAAILMDIQMPGMSGFEAVREIRDFERRSGRPHVFIIGVTAHALVGDRERCIAEGMDEYMSKPYHLEELKTKLEMLNS